MDLPRLDGFANEEIAILASALVDGTREWRREFESTPSDPSALSFRLTPGWHSAASVIVHMADVEAMWLSRLGLVRPEGEAEMMRSDQLDVRAPHWPDAPADLATLYEWNDRVRARSLAWLRDQKEPELLTAPREGRPRLTLRWVLNHLIGHEAYHAGQAVLLASYSARSNRDE